MAKTYHEVCPDDNILIVDYAASVGGVWAAERLYPGLKTNNLIGSYEFSDFPMVPERYGCTNSQHIPGAVVHHYLCDAVEYFDLASRFRFETKVDTASLTEDHEWLVETSTEKGYTQESKPQRAVIRARRMVVATGTTSEPYVPTFAGQERFRGSIIHSKQLRDRDEDLVQASSVVVLGGNKSAWDVCYRSAKFSKVHLVMRATGGGPCYCWPSQFKWFGLLTSLPRLSSTRFFTWFNPCIWGDVDGFRWVRYVLHRTWIGRKFNQLFWAQLRKRVQQIHGYDHDDNSRRMKPWTSPYWMGCSLSTHNYETPWFELTRQGKVEVHIAEVASLEENSARLSNGEVLRADALVCCTGWKNMPPMKFAPDTLQSRLGLPTSLTEMNEALSRAELSVYSQFPELRTRPQKSPAITSLLDIAGPRSLQQKPIYSLPYNLFRFTVPTDLDLLKQRNIAFIGFQLAVHAIPLAQAQALWITAFFLDKIPKLAISDLDAGKVSDIQSSAYLNTAFQRVRHPPEVGGLGERFPDLVFDCIPYIDLLLRDLRLSVRRKPTLWKELFEQYGKGDYVSLVQEWKRSVGMAE